MQSGQGARSAAANAAAASPAQRGSGLAAVGRSRRGSGGPAAKRGEQHQPLGGVNALYDILGLGPGARASGSPPTDSQAPIGSRRHRMTTTSLMMSPSFGGVAQDELRATTTSPSGVTAASGRPLGMRGAAGRSSSVAVYGNTLVLAAATSAFAPAPLGGDLAGGYGGGSNFGGGPGPSVDAGRRRPTHGEGGTRQGSPERGPLPLLRLPSYLRSASRSGQKVGPGHTSPRAGATIGAEDGAWAGGGHATHTGATTAAAAAAPAHEALPQRRHRRSIGQVLAR